MNSVLNNFSLINTEANVINIAITVVVGLILGLLIAAVYALVNKGTDFSLEFALTIVIVCAVIALIISVIGTNIARAFSLAGALSIVRFRSLQQKPANIAYIFFAMGAGLACGAGLFLPALAFVIIMDIAMLIFFFIKKLRKTETRVLKICVPEAIAFSNQFDEILKEYTVNYSLNKVRLISAGTVMEISYDVCFKNSAKLDEMLGKIREKNANFNVALFFKADEEKN